MNSEVKIQAPLASFMDSDAFAEIFEGMTVTFMGTRPLLRELVLLRAALSPVGADNAPMNPPTQEDVCHLTTLLAELLPPLAPESVGDLRRALGPLPPRQKQLLRHVAETAWRDVRAIPQPPPLWLVPAVYSHRICMTLEGQHFPAWIRYWMNQWRRAP